MYIRTGILNWTTIESSGIFATPCNVPNNADAKASPLTLADVDVVRRADVEGQQVTSLASSSSFALISAVALRGDVRRGLRNTF